MTSYSTALITDSICDLPEPLLRQYDIGVVPCYILWGSEQLRDRIDIQPEEFYRRLASDPVHPTTAQPTPRDFLRAYEAARQTGAREIVVICVSSAMSGTIESARQAATMIDLPIHIVDSKGPTMSLGWQVLAAARARAAGGDAQAMIAAADRVRASLVLLVAMDTLEYLYRGGRIGNATRWIGALLNVKPLVYIDHTTGLVEAGERVRTRKRAIETLYEGFFRQFEGRRGPLHICVLHGNAREEAERLAERVQAEFSPVELLITITTPVLGVHTGPGALALSGYVG